MSLMEINELYVDYVTKKGVTGKEQTVHAINGLSLNLNKGEILAIAGESGCGKSTLAKSIMKLIPLKRGEIKLNSHSISEFNRKDFYKNIQMVFQNPYSSLNPKMKIGAILREPLGINTKYSKDKINKIVEEKISQVGLDKSVLELYPHEFSGGQRQRIAIARSLVLEPEIIIADEPVSALDVSIQAQIINLLNNLKNNLGLTFLFISHDLGVIRYISDRVAVMYLGEIVEIGNTEEIFADPKHPYTKALLSAVPEINSAKEKNVPKLEGELPSPENLPKGCKFNTRCPYVMDICKNINPDWEQTTATHKFRCFLSNNQ